MTEQIRTANSSQGIFSKDSPVRRQLRGVRKGCLRFWETVAFGGVLRERFLLKLLDWHYRSVFRRDWNYRAEMPHFFNHRLGMFRFVFGDEPVSPYHFFRAFYSAEVLRPGDQLLDIGCGDGFFAKRFYAWQCAHIDAVDTDDFAIAVANRNNSAANITYHRLDAVNDPFPRQKYDVVIWDGAIGHFAPEVTRALLRKIRGVLADDGLFVGSESLGLEGHDHLQFFRSTDDLRDLFGPHFRHVELRSLEYDLSSASRRTEAYWRCGQQRGRLDQCGWQLQSISRQRAG